MRSQGLKVKLNPFGQVLFSMIMSDQANSLYWKAASRYTVGNSFFC